MDRSALRAVALAVLCLTVVALAAATIDDTKTASGEGSGGPNFEGPGDGNDGQVRTPDAGTERPRRTTRRGTVKAEDQPCWQPPSWIFVLVGLLALGIGVLIARKANAYVAVAIVAVLLAPALIGFNIATAGCKKEVEQDPGGGGGGDSADQSGGSGDDGSGDSNDPVTDPNLPTVLVIVLGVIAIAAIGSFVMTGDAEVGEDDPGEELEPEPESEVDVEAVGEAAGRAADRIEDADAFDNEIYRAWVEMTKPLDVEHPESSTPAEFATAAVTAGMDPDDVDRLTDLFEAVRYGDYEPTEDREQEAVELLRRIERTYTDVGDEESPGGDGA